MGFGPCAPRELRDGVVRKLKGKADAIILARAGSSLLEAKGNPFRMVLKGNQRRKTVVPLDFFLGGGTKKKTRPYCFSQIRTTPLET